MSLLLRLLAVVLILGAAGLAQAQTERKGSADTGPGYRLSGAQILKILPGATLHGRYSEAAGGGTWIEHYTPEGDVYLIQPEGRLFGRWRVVSDTVCYTYDLDPNGEFCMAVHVHGEQLDFVVAQGPQTGQMVAYTTAIEWPSPPAAQTVPAPTPQDTARYSREDVRAVQIALAAIGYDPGEPDGIIGPHTRAAIGAYQKDFNLPVTGEIDKTLLASLQTALTIARQQPDAPGRALGFGTGFVISDEGYVLTNQHVVADCGKLRAVQPGQPGSEISVVASDVTNDLALLLLPQPPKAVAPFRAGRSVRLGDDVVVLGFPLYGALASSVSVTTGTVSALAGLRDDIRFLQITAPVQPGNSGGPVLDRSGHVVAIVASKLDAIGVAVATGDIPQNVNFAIKDTVARSFLEAHGIPYVTAESGSAELSAADVADQARRFTVLVECWE